MSGGNLDANPFEAFRPQGMNEFETLLWEGIAGSTLAAFDRLCSASADKMTPAALDAVALSDATQAVTPMVLRLTQTPEVQFTLLRALSREAVASARAMWEATPQLHDVPRAQQ